MSSFIPKLATSKVQQQNSLLARPQRTALLGTAIREDLSDKEDLTRSLQSYWNNPTQGTIAPSLKHTLIPFEPTNPSENLAHGYTCPRVRLPQERSHVARYFSRFFTVTCLPLIAML